MVRTVILAALVLVCAIANAEARQRNKSGLHPECFISLPCVQPYASTSDQVRVARGRYIARQMGFGAAIEKPVRKPRRVAKADYRHVVRDRGVRKPARVVRQAEAAPTVQHSRIHVGRRTAEILPHPSGCPSRSFCGCGAALRVFGAPVRSLWLAANWLKFPRTAPAPGMVAARRGHVFVLEEDLGGGRWKVYDANSGRGLTRLHARSLAGYTVVNPRAAAGLMNTA